MMSMGMISVMTVEQHHRFQDMSAWRIQTGFAISDPKRPSHQAANYIPK